MNDTMLERAMRHDRILVVGGLSILVLVSWIYLILGPNVAGHDMAGMDMAMPMSTMPWTPGRWALMLLMWLVMMAAMMLPSAAPMILLYAKVARRQASGGQPAIGAGIFVLGYAAVWSAFSAVAVTLQFWLERLALLTPMMEMTSLALAGSVLIAAGIYQWTPWKHACLRRCRSPLDFVLTHWRSGTKGAFIMGLQHGLYCVGCCWLIMLLIFVGGVMNLYWIAGLAVFVLIEKLFPGGRLLSRTAGVLLMGCGAAILFAIP
jgi:predicted metal-binding membrane protein